jgi:tol-pal system protein YbgF
MKPSRLFLSVVFLIPMACSAASKEIVELQRDVAQLQDQVGKLQRSFDEKMGAIQVMVQQAADSAGKASTSVATLQAVLQEQLRVQGREIVAPVASLATKVDEMSQGFQQVQNSMADATARLGKVEQQLIDLGNAVRTMQTPAAPPPPTGSGSTSPAGTSAPSSPAQSIPPGGVLYQDAVRDKEGGKTDLALQEFSAYLKYYNDGPFAAAAQYHIGDIYFSQGDYENAQKAFDLVLEKYPANTKTPDAMYMKGRTLVKLDRRNLGANQFRELIKRYPSSEVAAKARAQLKSMGLSVSTSSASRRK